MKGKPVIPAGFKVRPSLLICLCCEVLPLIAKTTGKVTQYGHDEIWLTEMSQFELRNRLPRNRPSNPVKKLLVLRRRGRNLARLLRSPPIYGGVARLLWQELFP